jgi:tetratricopeptide (TPR) repeat protein
MSVYVSGVAESESQRGFYRARQAGIIRRSAGGMTAKRSTGRHDHGRKGGPVVTEHSNRAMVMWSAVLLAGFCSLPGCSPRQPVVDLYVDAVALRELGQQELAVKKLNEVVAADPDFALAYSELGKAYEAIGDHEKALAAFRRAASLDSWSFQDHLSLAQTCERLGRYPEAAAAYARAAELDPKSFQAILGAAKCALAAGDYIKSLAYCELAEQADKPGEVLPLLARVYEGQKNYSQAIRVYHRLLVLNGNDPNVLLSLGVAYTKAQQYEKAGPVLVSVTQLRPQDGAAFRHLGYCFVKLGNIEQALQMYRRAVDLDASDWEAHRGLGVACMMKAHQTADRRWQAEALEHWRRSLALRPDQPKHERLERLIRENSQLNDPLQGLSD